MCLVLNSLTIKQKTHGHFKIPFTPKQIVNIKKVKCNNPLTRITSSTYNRNMTVTKIII